MRHYIRLTLILTLSALCATAWAAHKQSTRIEGNPINRQAAFTINSPRTQTATVDCTFTNNSSTTPAKLTIWTAPDQTTPFQTITIPQAEGHNPAVKTMQYHFPLKKAWWCQLYTPSSAKKAVYCHYFSISDANIVKNNPFGIWNATERSRQLSYRCRLTKTHEALFFYFE